MIVNFSLLNNPSVNDNTPPSVILSTLANDPVLTSSVIVYATFSKGPIYGLTSGDLILSNCTVSDFTQLSNNFYSFVLNPTIDGVFTCQIPANSCAWNGLNNTLSNLLSKTYDTGASYDLDNAAEISLLKHYRGHTASFTDCTDLLSTINAAGMELLYSKHNMGATAFANSDNQSNRDMYAFGRIDFGVISFSFADFLVRDPLITAVRDGFPSSVMAYKNGNDDYSSNIIPHVLFARNSNYESVRQTLPVTYNNGITDIDFSSRGVTFRFDYYAQTTGTDYYSGNQALGDTRLESYVNNVISNNGWFTDFIHWHWQLLDYPERHFANLSALIENEDVFCGTFNKIVEYYWAREAVTSITATGNTITVNHTKDYPSSPYNRIKTPIWVKLDTTGSVFEGNDIACGNGLKIRKISNNVFYIPIILDFNNTSTSVSIGFTTSPNFVNLNKPVISRNGNTVTIDQNCKITIYKVLKPIAWQSSSTSNSIPTTDGTLLTFNIATGIVGTLTNLSVRVFHNSSNYFYATVNSYNSVTGQLVVKSSSFVGVGNYSSWTIDKYYHLINASVVERHLEYTNSYTIKEVLDVNYTYYVAAINEDGISNLI